MELDSQRQQTPFHEAARSGDVDKVGDLLEGGKYDVNCVTISGWTPFHMAAASGHLGVVRVLISEFKAEVNAGDNKGSTPIDKAISNNREEMALALVNEFQCDVKQGYIHTACKRGWVNLVRALVQKCIEEYDVNAPFVSGYTPFEVAVNNKSEEVALALMNEFHCDTKGGTPYIHTACKRGWVNLVRALVQKHGTGILKDDVNISTTLFEEAVNNNREEVALALMNEFHCDTKGGTPYIHTACKRGWLDLVRALVQKHGTGILNHNVGATQYYATVATPLHDVIAKRYGDEMVVMLHREFGSSVKNLDGQTIYCTWHVHGVISV